MYNLRIRIFFAFHTTIPCCLADFSLGSSLLAMCATVGMAEYTCHLAGYEMEKCPLDAYRVACLFS